MRRALHIAFALLLLAACGPRKIDREDMVAILADMLVQDQQVKQSRELRKQADSSLVYEGIFRAYGYDTDDFRYSVKYYLEDPSRMEKIMGDVAGNLESRTKVVAKEIHLDEWRRGLLRIYNMPADTSAPHPRPRPVDTLHVRFQGDTVYLYTVDSLSMKDLDTLLFHPVDSL